MTDVIITKASPTERSSARKPSGSKHAAGTPALPATPAENERSVVLDLGPLAPGRESESLFPRAAPAGEVDYRVVLACGAVRPVSQKGGE